MKREIKFRALKSHEGRFIWIYGLLIYDTDGQTPMIQAVNPFNPSLFYTCMVGTECQFTGLKDEKDREIYDGDIYFDEIEEDDGDVRLYYVCKWIDEWARFVWLNVDGELQDYEDNGVENFIDYNFVLETKRMHYAGNIYENPELLKSVY